MSFRPRIGVRGDITSSCHSAPDAESGKNISLWITQNWMKKEILASGLSGFSPSLSFRT